MTVIKNLARCLSWMTVLLLTGCDGLSLVAVYSDDRSQQISFQEILPKVDSAINERRFTIVRHLTAWHALWDEHTANQSPQPPAPAINFSQTMVAGVFLGSRSNSCYQVSIHSVARHVDPDRIEITFKESLPPPGAVCATVITHPAALITLPYSNLPVEFLELH